MHISRTQYYDIKNHKIPVSKKMWAALAAAENVAGMKPGNSKAPDRLEEPTIPWGSKPDPSAAQWRAVLHAAAEAARQVCPHDPAAAEAMLDRLTALHDVERSLPSRARLEAEVRAYLDAAQLAHAWPAAVIAVRKHLDPAQFDLL